MVQNYFFVSLSILIGPFVNARVGYKAHDFFKESSTTAALVPGDILY